jgi:hypothetical protein
MYPEPGIPAPTDGTGPGVSNPGILPGVTRGVGGRLAGGDGPFFAGIPALPSGCEIVLVFGRALPLPLVEI